MLPGVQHLAQTCLDRSPLLAATGCNALDTYPFLVGQMRWVDAVHIKSVNRAALFNPVI